MHRTAAILGVLFLLALGACVDLAKVDPGPRFIDDFEDGGAPTWNRFSPWTCDEINGAVGKDAGARDGGVADAGRPAQDAATASTCKLSLEQPGSDDQQALESVFTIEPTDGVRDYPGTEIVSRTVGHGTVDVTGFTQLVFAAILESAPPSPSLPSSTQFLVELGCSALSSNPMATSQPVPYTLNAGWTELRLSLSTFTLNNTSRNQSCLALLDSIHFVVMPGRSNGAPVGGTLHIDNISLQN